MDRFRRLSHFSYFHWLRVVSFFLFFFPNNLLDLLVVADLSVVEDAPGLGADVGVEEDLGVAAVRVLAAQLPHVEEGLPVDDVDQPLQVVVLQHPHAQKRRPHCNP